MVKFSVIGLAAMGIVVTILFGGAALAGAEASTKLTVLPYHPGHIYFVETAPGSALGHWRQAGCR